MRRKAICLRRTIPLILMKLRRSLLTIGFAFSTLGLAQGDPLRDQLDLARKADDRLAQTEILQRLLQQEPHDPEVRERLASLWLLLDDYEQAVNTVRDENLVSPGFRVRILAPSLFYYERKPDEAIALLSDYHAKTPDDFEVTRMLVEYLVATNQYQKLVELLDRAPGVKNSASLLVARASARRSLQDFDGALRDFKEAVSVDSSDKAVFDQRPSFQRLEEALGHIKAASAALEKAPGDVPARLSRAYWYLYAGSANTLAAKDAAAARQAEPDFVSARLLDLYAANLVGPLSAGEVQKTSRVDVGKPLPKWSEFESILRSDQALKSQPRDAKALTARATQLNAAQQYLLAQDDADAALALAPNDAAARLPKIVALVRLKQFEPAAAEYRLLEEGKPPRESLALAAGALADAAFAESKFEVALDYANRSIKAQPTVQYYRERAAILRRLNRGAEAEADLAKANSLSKKATR